MKIEEMIKQLKRDVSVIEEFKEPLDEAGGKISYLFYSTERKTHNKLFLK